MDIGHINGPSGVERSADRDRTARSGAVAASKGRAEGIKSTDSAAISATGRGTLEAVESFTERARNGEDRAEIVAQAKARLESGELATNEAFDAAARSLLSGGF